MKAARPKTTTVNREKRVSRTYRLPLSKLRAAQKALGAATATETIERALDMIVFQEGLVEGTKKLLGMEIVPFDDDDGESKSEQ